MSVFPLYHHKRLTDRHVENITEKSGGDASHSGHYDKALHIFMMRYNSYAGLCGIIGKSDSL